MLNNPNMMINMMNNPVNSMNMNMINTVIINLFLAL